MGEAREASHGTKKERGARQGPRDQEKVIHLILRTVLDKARNLVNVEEEQTDAADEPDQRDQRVSSAGKGLGWLGRVHGVYLILAGILFTFSS